MKTDRKKHPLPAPGPRYRPQAPPGARKPYRFTDWAAI